MKSIFYFITTLIILNFYNTKLYSSDNKFWEYLNKSDIINIDNINDVINTLDKESKLKILNSLGHNRSIDFINDLEKENNLKYFIKIEKRNIAPLTGNEILLFFNYLYSEQVISVFKNSIKKENYIDSIELPFRSDKNIIYTNIISSEYQNICFYYSGDWIKELNIITFNNNKFDIFNNSIYLSGSLNYSSFDGNFIFSKNYPKTITVIGKIKKKLYKNNKGMPILTRKYLPYYEEYRYDNNKYIDSDHFYKDEEKIVVKYLSNKKDIRKNDLNYIFDFKNIRNLDLSDKYIDNKYVNKLTNFINLEYINLSNTINLSSDNYIFLSKLKHLKKINLYNNVNFNSISIKNIASLELLEYINLLGCDIKNNDLKYLENKLLLKALYFNCTSIQIDSINCLTNCKYIRSILLDNSSIKPGIINNLCNIKSLKLLSLENTDINNEILKEIKNHKNLEFLIINNCKNITFEGILALKGMKLLKAIRFDDNQINSKQYEILRKKWPKISSY